jgi:hypothetical protein
MNKLSTLELHFEYKLPKKVVFDWWTDLSGEGYVGKALKSIKLIGREGEKMLVETRWSIMGRTVKLLEKFTVHSEEHWTWEPSIFGIAITDDFILKEEQGKTGLTIHSEIRPKGFKGKIAHIMLGWYLDRMMLDEWKSASEGFVSETARKGLSS